MSSYNLEVEVKLTDDTLENIKIMAPMLDEAGQNRVVGLMCGLLSIGRERSSHQSGEEKAG